MTNRAELRYRLTAVGLGALVAAWSAAACAQAVRIDADDIGGVVTGPKGPEAGVWVIAETTDLPTKFVRIVVSDDQGRYLVPDLPKASYSIWVRGYGLIDSPKLKSEPGKLVNLTALTAANAQAAAQYYPAIYWYSMLDIPDKGMFPLTGGTNIQSQAQWLDSVKTNGCITCHQLGNAATRLVPGELGHFDTTQDAWERRIQSGQAAGNMVNAIGRLDNARGLALFAKWTDRIQGGELPFAQPTRPQGLERNVVVTLWDWSDAKTYLHDEISTDRRNPTVNAYGKLFGSPELSTDRLPVLDPATNKVAFVMAPPRDKNTPTTADDPIFAASPYWGDEAIWDSQSNIHNPMLDEKGRVWLTHRIRTNNNPAFCKAGSDHPAAKAFPIAASGRQLSMYDPKTGQFTYVDTCFGTHHLQFAADANNTLWTSGGGQVIGWLDRKLFEETGDAAKAQGWTPMIIDTNGNGKRDAYVEPNQPVDPTKDKRVVAGFYSVSPNPVDGTVWGTSTAFPGMIVRVNPGPNPVETALTEIYQVPGQGGVRGGDIDSQGVFWAGLADGNFASFDRRKCNGPLNGPDAASGKLCPEGWTLSPFPGPQFASLKAPGSAESSYYTWVDQFNTSGLGKDVPIATGNLNESLIALVDGKMVQLRVPYPMGFFAKGLDGRIDDPNAGWKGKGLWTTFGNRTPFHVEGGKGTLPKVLHFQLRPDPLAN